VIISAKGGLPEAVAFGKADMLNGLDRSSLDSRLSGFKALLRVSFVLREETEGNKPTDR
jgi:hypothetical protein